MKRRRRRWHRCCRSRGSISRSLWLTSSEGLERQRPNLRVRPLLCAAILSDCPSAAADEVHDDRDHGEDEQKVYEETAHVQDEEPAEPEQNQHNSQNEKHE